MECSETGVVPNGRIKRQVYVNIPFSMLMDSYLDSFVQHGLNAEIGLDAEALDSISPDRFKAIHEKLVEADLRVTIHSPFIDLSAGSPDHAIREVTRRRFEQVMGVARILSPQVVVCHAGYDEKRYGFIREVWLRNSIDTWKWMAEGLAEEGITLTLENVHEERPEYLLPLFEELEDLGVKFCFDTGHQAAFGKASIHEWLSCLGGFLGQLHLHDNNGGRDEHLGLGCGTIDFTALFDWLRKRRGEPPVITLEPHRKEDLLPSLKWLEQNWPW